VLEDICSGAEVAGLPDWEDFKADLQDGVLTFPFRQEPLLVCW